MRSVLERFLKEEFLEFSEELLGRGRVSLSGFTLTGKAFFLSFLLREQMDKAIVLVSRDDERAYLFSKALSFFRGIIHKREVAFFPYWDKEPYEITPPHPDILRRRVGVLFQLLKSKGKGVISLSPGSLIFPTIPQEELSSLIIVLRKEEEFPFLKLPEFLSRIGYERVDLVESPGEFAVRGGIVDIFSPLYDEPARVEFFGEKVEGIRNFDPRTQRSLSPVDELVVIPMRELVLDSLPPSLSQGSAEASYAEKELSLFLEDGSLRDLIYLVPKEDRERLSSYFSSPLVVFDEPALLEDEFDHLRYQFARGYERAVAEGRHPLPPEALLFSPEEWLNGKPLLELRELGPLSGISYPDFYYQGERVPSYRGDISRLASDLAKAKDEGVAVLIVLGSEGEGERLSELLSEKGLSPVLASHSDIFDCLLPGTIAITKGELVEGIRLPALNLLILTSREIFPPERKKEVPRKGKSAFSFSLRELRVGDYVVHEEHGVGIFRGLTKMELGGEVAEFIEIEYRGGDKLYIPFDKLHLVHKYSSGEGAPPRIDKLGGSSFAKVKRRVKRAVRDMTRELLNLYAVRKAIKGYAFGPDTPWQREFEDAFPYEETEDQLIAIAEVKRDMEEEKPMDRLLCGDVGYGKTEVAMRAAFKAVMEGKQVAVLVPTTVLAFQHFRTFNERFRAFPIRIEHLSRFRSRKEQKKIVEALAKGEVDIVIGTHRLLSADVKFRDLGLLIIDEEQRFGVAQKEKIKRMKKKVDVLTMTATPIPRTLNMALAGVRDLSIIETPPRNRLAIQTIVAKFSPELIQEAVERELRRGGQVYFVHNRVETIYSMGEYLSRLLPGVKIAISHGKMRERDLERTMLSFIEGEYDLLLTTTIIENGVDIPRVNTLIVNRADQFGLAQLYQLRGRVGRSDVRAYAYLLVPSERGLTEQARMRLKAIKEFAELGSGFRLAAMDLEIRGAGNLLGPEQHGHIEAVGFEYYCRLLEETARELKGEKLPEEVSCKVSLRLDIHIPEDYLPDANLRLITYRRLSTIRDEEELSSLEAELRDRYGRPPEPVRNLLGYVRLKLLGERLRISSIDREGGTIILKLAPDTKVSPDKLIALVSSGKGEFSPSGVLKVPLPDGASPISFVQKLLLELS
ncbi:MAG: transcription-repair coupling factor [Acidobacteria bacterium]|nr:transcription-repair coupling factor [Acidobacteriota bacterium]